MGSSFLVNYILLFLFVALSLTNMIMIYAIAVGKIDILPLLLISSINIFIHFKFNTKYGIQLQALSYLIKKILVFSKKE